MLGNMAKFACEEQTSKHRHSTSISGLGYACLPFPTQPGLLLELFFIILGYRAVRSQLHLLVSGRRQATTATWSPASPFGPGIVIFNTTRISRGQLSSSVVCVQQLWVHEGQDQCPVSSQTRSQDHWLTQRSHLDAINILFLLFH